MLLAFDTATAHVGVALSDHGRVVAEYSSTQAMRHGEMLAPGISQVLADAKVGPPDLTGIVVGVGPGPFTGLRVGLVTARTMAYALGIEARGVCSLDAIAADVAGPSEFVVATDARRKEVYAARYRDGVRVDGPTVQKPAEVIGEWPVAGAGGEMYAEHFVQRIEPQFPRAATLARIVTEQLFPLEPVEPLYLRRPDAVVPGPPKDAR